MDAGRSGYEVTVKNCGRVGSSRVKGQQWTIHGDGTLKLQRNSAMCLTKSGNSVGVARCSVSRRSDQKWKMMENKDETTLCLVLGNGACLNSALELIEAPVAVFGKKAAVPKDLARFDVSFSPTPGKSVGDEIWSDEYDLGQASRVRYGISQQDENAPNGFSIDGTTGQIRVQEAFLNYEGVKTSFDITIFVLDDGFNSDGVTVQECDVDYSGLFENDGRCRLSTEARVTINVVDVNEEPIIYDQLRMMDENMPTNSFVGKKVFADDPDFDDTLDFQIVAGNNQNMFKIESCSGQIILNKPGLDYEQGGTAAFHVLDIRVNDKSGAFSTGKVTIRVKDLNEAPEVTTPKPFSLMENSPLGTIVGPKMVGFDIDAGHGRLLRWYITQGNVGDAFQIDEVTGQVSVLNGKSLNYEEIPIGMDGWHTPFLLEIEARDVGLLPTQTFTKYSETVLPVALKPMGCKDGSVLTHSKWVDLEADSTYTSLLTRPAAKVVAAAQTKHAWVWTSGSCMHDDKVDASMNGQNGGDVNPSCADDGLKLNSGSLPDPGTPGSYKRKLQIGEKEDDRRCTSDSQCKSNSCDTDGTYGCENKCTLPRPWSIKKSSKTCLSSEVVLGTFDASTESEGIALCAAKCVETLGCQFFTFGSECASKCGTGDTLCNDKCDDATLASTISFKANEGKCNYEKTSTSACNEGWVTSTSDFYEVTAGRDAAKSTEDNCPVATLAARDGYLQHIDFGTAQLKSDFTASIWFTADAATNTKTRSRLLTFCSDETATECLTIDLVGGDRKTIEFNAVATGTASKSTVQLRTGEIQHIVVSVNSKGNKRIHVNGVEDKGAMKFGSAPMPELSHTIAYLGRPADAEDSSITYYAGHVRKMSTWDRELTEEDVEALYAYQQLGLAEPRPSYGAEINNVGRVDAIARCAEAAVRANLGKKKQTLFIHFRGSFMFFFSFCFLLFFFFFFFFFFF